MILDEIAMHDDDPDDVVHNLFAEQAWGDLAAGPADRRHRRVDQGADPRPRSGATTGAATRPANMVVAVAGNVDHATVVRRVKQAFARSGFLDGDRHRSPAPRAAAPAAPTASGDVVVTRPFEQVNLVLGVNGLVRTDERRYALGVLNAALGGGTSSRLFQEVRERRGPGLLGLLLRLALLRRRHVRGGRRLPAVQGHRGAGGGPQRARAAGPDGISPVELQRGQGQLRGGLVLSLEDSGSRMSRIAKAELLYDELPSIDDVLQRVAEVTLEDVNALARELFTQPQTLAVVGPFDTLPG